MADSRISGFYKLGYKERQNRLKENAGLSDEDFHRLDEGGLTLEAAEKMIENVIGTSRLPMGVAMNFLINGRDYLIPMVLEEPSVVAAASNAAKIMREGGGITASSDEPVMIGQIQVVEFKQKDAVKRVEEKKEEIVELANSQDPILLKFGGGVRDLTVRKLKGRKGEMIIVHLHVDVRDAMGANAVNTMCEAVAPKLEELTGGKAILRIISNYATERLARAEVTIPKEALGEDNINRIVWAQTLAEEDVYRAVTHNKGIMNGITAVTLATCNDTRAVEAGAHSYASRSGEYKPLTIWAEDEEGNLKGRIELPIAVGLVGGATKTHPSAQAAVKILGVKTARELAEVMASVGLAQNFAALRALATEGIQRGHMELHARNVAIAAGAKGKDVDRIAEQMIKEKKIRADRAKELLGGR
ncbi:MAG: hydroxymethylglutaryl-CoA reductase, degradative [Candidatus Altiarchaeota archaeon]